MKKKNLNSTSITQLFISPLFELIFFRFDSEGDMNVCSYTVKCPKMFVPFQKERKEKYKNKNNRSRE